MFKFVDVVLSLFELCFLFQTFHVLLVNVRPDSWLTLIIPDVVVIYQSPLCLLYRKRVY